MKRPYRVVAVYPQQGDLTQIWYIEQAIAI